jgi:hypothetical protein
LSDVYQVIGYYLKNRAELCEYFKTRELEEQALWPIIRSGRLPDCASV